MTDRLKLYRRRGGSPNVADMDADSRGARRARALLRGGKFAPLEEVVAGTTDPNERTYLAEALADWAGPAPWVERWRQHSALPFARTVAGIWRIKHAWDFTPWTRGEVDLVKFGEQLKAAKAELIDAAKADPRCAAPFPWLMWIARGRRDEELYGQALAEGLRRSPATKLIYSSALYSESPHWFGSHERLTGFAHRHARTAPRGIGAPTLIVEAHLFADPQFGQGSGGYWHQPTVRHDVIAAAKACDAEGYHGMNGVRTRYWLAFGLWKSAEFAAAAPHFRALGTVWNQVPWSGMRILNRLLNPYYKARKQCLAAG